MKIKLAGSILLASACLLIAGCNGGRTDPNAGAPPPVTVEPDLDANNFKVDNPEQFLITTAIDHKAAPALNVTGVVQPDIARAVPVISLTTGRVVEIKARLGDHVEKGQLLLRVRSNANGRRHFMTKVLSPRAVLNKLKTPNRTPKSISIRPPNNCDFSA